MATYRVRDRSGGTLQVSSKAQADYWVALGYKLVEDDKPAKAPAAKKAASKSTSE